MNYHNTETPIQLGDRVLLAEAPARIVVAGYEGRFSPEFPAEEWRDVVGDALLLCFENKALVRIEIPDEELKFVRRES